MKTKILKSFLSILLIFSSLKVINSCANRDETISCFPKSLVSVQLNLNLPAYYNLQNIGGWVYVSEQQSGTRGLIVARTSSTEFKIYDRNAPHICPDQETTLTVENGTYVICKKDNQKWFLSTGGGANTNTTSKGLVWYSYQFSPSSNILNIYN